MNLLRKYASLVQGDKYDFRDRQFIMLTGMIEVALFIVLIADIILGENIVEIIVIAVVALIPQFCHCSHHIFLSLITGINAPYCH